jgi:hypothetical protein
MAAPRKEDPLTTDTDTDALCDWASGRLDNLPPVPRQMPPDPWVRVQFVRDMFGPVPQ